MYPKPNANYSAHHIAGFGEAGTSSVRGVQNSANRAHVATAWLKAPRLFFICLPAETARSKIAASAPLKHLASNPVPRQAVQTIVKSSGWPCVGCMKTGPRPQCN